MKVVEIIEQGESLPSRERGLKLHTRARRPIVPGVAPFTGAWIETVVDRHFADAIEGRSLHGSVD